MKPPVRKRHLLWKKNRRGVREPYHVVSWTEAGKRRERAIKLDWRGDLRVLDDLYWQAESGQHPKQLTTPKQTWADLVKEWRADPRNMKLADGTRRSYRREMDALLLRNADKPVSGMTRAGLRKVHAALSDTPRKADWRVQIVSLLWNYGATRLDWPLGPNPAKGWDFYGATVPFEPWPPWMVEALSHAPDTVRTAAHLIIGKGERPGAAIGTRWADFSGEWMVVRDEKSDADLEVFCPPSLTAHLAAVPRAGVYVLARNLREPLGYDAVEKQFRAWRKTLGEQAAPYSLHGLRKLAIVQLAEAGCSDAEIQAITNQSAETVAYYRTRASRKIMSKNAQLRRDRG